MSAGIRRADATETSGAWFLVIVWIDFVEESSRGSKVNSDVNSESAIIVSSDLEVSLAATSAVERIVKSWASLEALSPSIVNTLTQAR